MEEYRNTVIKLHAIYSMIISKFTSNISKNTSKFATSLLSWLYSPPKKEGGSHGPRPQLAVEELQGGIPSGCHGSHGK